jgi:hypothetical protein
LASGGVPRRSRDVDRRNPHASIRAAVIAKALCALHRAQEVFVTTAARLRWHELLTSLPEPSLVTPATPGARLHDVLYPALVRAVAERPLLGRLFPVAQRYAVTLRRSPEDAVDIGTAAVSIPHCYGSDERGPYWLMDRPSGDLLAHGQLRVVVDLLEQRAVAVLSTNERGR